MLTPILRKGLKVLISVLALAAGTCSAKAVTLSATADTDTQSDVAAGTNANLNVSQYCIGLTKFDLSSVTGSVTSAKLRIYFPNGSAATTYTVSQATPDTWTEGGAKPSVGAAITTTAITSATPAGYIEIDVTSYVQAKMSGNKIASMAFTNTLSGWTTWSARQAPSNTPQLVVTTGTTSTTTNLNPTADTDSQSDVAAGTNANLNVSQYCVALLRFDISGITGSASSATLRLYLPNGTAATTFTVATTSTDSWSEGGAKPTAGSTIMTKTVGALGAAYVDFDLTSHVQGKLSGNKIVSVAVTNTLSGWSTWNSRGATSNKPLLVVVTGSAGGGGSAPAITSGTSASATAGSAFSYQIVATNSPTSYGATSLSGTGLSLNTSSGLISGTPTAAGTITSTLTATNTSGTSAPVTLTINVASSGGGGSAPAITSGASASATAGSAFSYQIVATNSPTSYGATNLSGTGLSLNTSSGLISGTPTAAGTITSTLTATNTSGTSAPVTLTINVASSGGGGTHTGFYVSGSRLYDKNGVEFHIRGINKNHWDFGSTGMWNTNANTWRFVIDFNQPTSTNLSLMQDCIAHHVVPMPGNWNGTCKDESYLDAIVTSWVDQASAWKTIDDKMLLNIANELGSSGSTSWRDAYINAITRIRNAGYKCPIVVDSGGCGQDADDIINFGNAVLNADPLRNVIFDVHIYGNWTTGGSPSWAIDLNTALNQIQATGLCVIVGEFGPGMDIGPSPTMLTPGQIIQGADARNFGWLAWAWDDNPTAPDGSWFNLCNNGSLNYNTSADLTFFGKDVIENTVYGLKVKAVKQTVF